MASDLETQLGVLRSRLNAVIVDWAALPDKEQKDSSRKREFSARVRECNSLVRGLRTQLRPQCPGHSWRDPKKGDWGHWVPAASPPSGRVVESQQVRLDALPVTRVHRKEISLFWQKGKKPGSKAYLAFYPSTNSGKPERVHRGYWQDVFRFRLPYWIHVDHEFGERGDCRLSQLQLLTEWENSGRSAGVLPSGSGVEGAAAAAAVAAAAPAAAAPAAAAPAVRFFAALDSMEQWQPPPPPEEAYRRKRRRRA